MIDLPAEKLAGLEKQYEFFVRSYDQESDRSKSLEAKSQVIIGLVSGFAAIFISQLSTLKSVLITCAHVSLFLTSCALLVGALFCSFNAIRIRSFLYIANLDREIEEIAPSITVFYVKKLSDIRSAQAHNRQTNDRKAFFVKMSGLCLATALILLVGLVGWRVI